jgi:TRAP-type C4-dicarboxylate transport system permease small subunit
MAIPTTGTSPPPRRLWRSTAAVLFGFFAIVFLSLGTDQVLHVLEVYPPWGEPMYGTGLLLALSYRIVYGVVGSYIAARFAPRHPMRHALPVGVIGLVLSTAGAIAMWDFGPNGYPIALAFTALPCAWLGGALYRKDSRSGELE